MLILMNGLIESVWTANDRASIRNESRRSSVHPPPTTRSAASINDTSSNQYSDSGNSEYWGR